MAQREKEETEFKVPETLILCTNNCGCFGNPATLNMCQKCFQAHMPPTPSCSAHEKPKTPSIRLLPSDKPAGIFQIQTSDPPAPARQVNRCSGCRRKVGLTGFRCRCGDLFCSEHRYSDRHACSYDYRGAGREAIARENPVVKAAKILRI
ncbi:hypothetical protein MRB53_012304 [Persea americana]|uniref:Uncharacterized protein n=1 Tax=Persea americana TaxID=3435 RepID=A0ACC2LX19_PERAE|nr:hypothetical protein MRB53_012304 [Persea americana]